MRIHCRLLVIVYLVVWTAAFSSSSLERSALTIVEPETGCQVVLVGCFHGSTTSANDVKEALDDAATDGAVLELCTDRCADLMKPAPSSEEKKLPWWRGLSRRVAQTREKQGLSTATTMAVLGGFSGIAQSSSGMTPGIEFRTALDIAKDRRLDVILADQPVDITLQRLSQLPSVALDVLMSQQFLEEARSLQRAVFGTKARHLSLLSFLTRSDESSGDILKYLLLPTSVFVTLQLLMGEQGGTDASATVAPAFGYPVDFAFIFGDYSSSNARDPLRTRRVSSRWYTDCLQREETCSSRVGLLTRQRGS